MKTKRSTPVTILALPFWEAYVADHDPDRVVERETVVVSSGGGGGAGVIAAIALLIVVIAVLYYFGMLPI